MNLTSEALQTIAAICGDATMVALFRGCDNQDKLDKTWGTYASSVEDMLKNWQTKAGIGPAAAPVSSAPTASGGARSEESILAEFAASVQLSLRKSMTPETMKAWLQEQGETSKFKGLRDKYEAHIRAGEMEQALLLLKMNQVDILIGGQWV